MLSEKWGEGTVQRYDDDQVTVLFDEHGYREPYLPVVLERDLLREQVAAGERVVISKAGTPSQTSCRIRRRR